MVSINFYEICRFKIFVKLSLESFETKFLFGVFNSIFEVVRVIRFFWFGWRWKGAFVPNQTVKTDSRKMKGYGSYQDSTKGQFLTKKSLKHKFDRVIVGRFLCLTPRWKSIFKCYNRSSLDLKKF